MGETSTSVQETEPATLAGSPAPWGRRVVAWLLDAAVLSAATWLVAGAGVDSPEPTPFFGHGGPARWTTSPWLWGVVLGLLVVQGLTGQTPGKRVLAIAVVDDVTGRPVGVLRTLVRQLAHVLDVLLVVGYLRPAWHRERRTFADSLLRTLVVVRRRQTTGSLARRVADDPVTTAAAVVCVLALGFGVPWYSRTDATVVDRPVCGAGTLAQGPVQGVVEVAEAREVQVRLWVRRDQTIVWPLAVVWSYPAGSLAGTSVGVRAQLRSADGTLLDPVDLTGTPGDGSDIGDDSTRVELSEWSGSSTWGITSTITVDDQPVATCQLSWP